MELKMANEKRDSDIYDELTINSPIMQSIKAKFLYDSHGEFYVKQEVKSHTPPRIVYPTRMSLDLHAYKKDHESGYVTCTHCGITYNLNSNESREFHNIQHLKLANFINMNCIYSSMDTAKLAIDTACRFFDMYDDYDTLMRAAHMLLLGYYSRYVISNFQCRTSAKMTKDNYFAEYIAVNPEKFPESIYNSLVDMWVRMSKDMDRSKYTLGFDPDDPLDPAKRRRA